MAKTLDDRLRALSDLDYEASLDGLEGAVWARIERGKRSAAAPSAGVRFGLVAAALALGLAVGMGGFGHKVSGFGSEMTVLSDDSGLAPSLRLGGA